MIDQFTIQTLLLNLLITIGVSGVFYIKNKQSETIKIGFLYSVCLYLVNLYQHSITTLLLGLFISIYLYKNSINSKVLAYLLTLTSISLINSTYDNFWYLTLSNFTILFIYFLLFSKIIFKNNTCNQTIILDLLEWKELHKNQILKDKLQTLTSGVIISIETPKIDNIREEVTINITYER